ncbi:MAG: redoxin domain-containing protein [Lewinellaceae bacterium]|nr:redoxin domain-containing protein [Lewinellaceae bacterium]
MAELPFLEQTGIWDEMVTANSGESLADLSEKGTVLLVFLRHFGCSFCREAISDISKRRKKLEAKGVRVVLVHMATDLETAEKFFKKITSLILKKSITATLDCSVAHQPNCSGL